MTRRRRKRAKGRWSKNETKLLRKTFRHTSTADVATKLRRSVASVQTKASALGLRKTKKYLRSIGKA